MLLSESSSVLDRLTIWYTSRRIYSLYRSGFHHFRPYVSVVFLQFRRFRDFQSVANFILLTKKFSYFYTNVDHFHPLNVSRHFWMLSWFFLDWKTILFLQMDFFYFQIFCRFAKLYNYIVLIYLSLILKLLHFLIKYRCSIFLFAYTNTIIYTTRFMCHYIPRWFFLFTYGSFTYGI